VRENGRRPVTKEIPLATAAKIRRDIQVSVKEGEPARIRRRRNASKPGRMNRMSFNG
jgi:hypothetical protein